MCGIFGIANNKKSAELTAAGLFALQHRGQESAGIAVDAEGEISAHIGMGLVSEVFKDDKAHKLKGLNAIGHVRYSTTGISHISNSQPIKVSNVHGQIAVAHNGNLTNSAFLRAKLEKEGALFQTTTDSEIILHLSAREKGPVENAIIKSAQKLEGAYSFIFLMPGKLIGLRDPRGFRPLVLGKLGGSYILSSETTAIEIVGGEFVRDIKPGEMVIIEGDELKTIQAMPAQKKLSSCIFELIYLSRPDSVINGKAVAVYRKELGRRLARQMKDVKADIVIPVLDSGVFAAMGLAEESGIPLEFGMIRNHYIGRSFIKATQELREQAVKMKLAAVPDLVKGKAVILVDDSIVRGTTSKKIVAMLKKAGALKIHFASSCPPIIGSCFYGIDTPKRDKLIANNMDVKKLAEFLGAESVTYLPIGELLSACGGIEKDLFCLSCFTGEYPTEVPEIL